MGRRKGDGVASLIVGIYRRFISRNMGIRLQVLFWVLVCSTAVAVAQGAADYEDATDTTMVAEEELAEYVVTGQYTPQSLKNSVYKITVINQEKIQAKSATNVQQILNTELGIRYNNDMALGVSDVAMMGMSGRNLKILIDGVPVLDRGDMRESLNQIDISQIEKIELVEGPMSIVYGTDALAGVINIITKKTKAASWQLSARLQEETVGKEYKPMGTKGLHAQYLSGQWDNGKWNVLIGMNHYAFAGFGGDAYNRNHSWKPKEQWMPSMKVGFRNAAFNIYYRPDYLYETIWAKGAINQDTYKGLNKQFVTHKWSHQLQSSFFLNDKTTLNAIGSYADYTRTTTTRIKNFATQEEMLSTGVGEQDVAAFKSVNFRSTLQYAYSRKFSFQPGVELNHETASGDRIAGNPAYTDWSGFLSAEYKPNNKLNLRPGVRITKNSLYDAPPVIPSLNTLYHFNKRYSLRMSYARGYRAPALRELYFDYVDANHNLKGNPDLEAENSHSFTGSLTYSTVYDGTKAINSEVGAFYNRFDNLISLAADPNDPTQYININIDHYRTSGISMKNRFRSETIEASINGLLLGQYNTVKDNPAVALDGSIPDFNWSPELSFEFSYLFPKTQTRITAFYKFTGSRQSYNYDTDTTANYALSIVKMMPYHYADFSISQKINDNLRLLIGARNLFDVVDIRNTGVSAGGVHTSGGTTSFGYGRSYFLCLTFNLEQQTK